MPSPARAPHLASFVDSWVESGCLPGAIVGCWHREQETFVHVSGWANVATGDRLTRDHLFRIYSMTKPITACALMLLVEDGKVSLEDHVSKYLPAFAEARVCVGGTVDAPLTEPANKAITLLHLLTHTSGISYGIFSSSIPDEILKARVGPAAVQEWCRPLSSAELCAHIAATPLSFQPGTAYLYSLGIDVIGHIIELVSGQSLDVFLRQRIFEPLGMRSTWFTVPPEHAHRLVSCYQLSTGFGYSPSQSSECDRLTVPPLLSGGGGLVSSLDDYARFARCLMRHGKGEDGRQVFRAESVAELARNHLPGSAQLDRMVHDTAFSENSDKAGLGFGLGVSVITEPALTRGGQLSGAGEFGWGGIASTWFFVDPAKELVTVFLTQLIPSTAYPIRPQLRYLAHWVHDSYSPEESPRRKSRLATGSRSR